MAPPTIIDTELDQLRADLEREIERTRRFLERKLKDGKITPSVEAARRLADELADLLKKNLGTAVRGYAEASQRVLEAAVRDLGDIGIPVNFTTPSVASLRAQVDGTLSDITQIADEAQAELRTFLVDTVRSGVPPSLDDLLDKVNGKAAQAVTLVDTGLAGFDRAVMVQQASEAGVDWFLYDGPLDEITRPFCNARVGKKFTIAMLDAIENDTGPNPPSLYCGGWNCRHRLTPLLLQEDIDATPTG